MFVKIVEDFVLKWKKQRVDSVDNLDRSNVRIYVISVQVTYIQDILKFWQIVFKV